MARKSHQDSVVQFCYGQSWARKSHQDSAERFATAKRWPEKANETQQYDLVQPRVGQKEPPRLGNTICYGQTWARKKNDLLRPNLCQKKPPRLGSTICYGQEVAKKNHRDSAVRFVTAKRGPERASTICYGQELARNSHRDSAVRSICYGQTSARKSHRDSAVRFVTAKRGPEKTTETLQHDLVRLNVGNKEHPKTQQYDLLRPNVGQKEPPRLGSTICYGQMWARKSHRDSPVRFVTDKTWPERATNIPQYDLLQPNVCQKEPPKLSGTICSGQELARKSHGDLAVRFFPGKHGPERATKTRQHDLLRLNARFVTANSWPERATKTRQYDLLPNMGQKERRDSAVRFVTAKRVPERDTDTQQYDLFRPRVGQKKPLRLGSTTLRPNASQKEPPRLGSTICYGQK